MTFQKGSPSVLLSQVLQRFSLFWGEVIRSRRVYESAYYTHLPLTKTTLLSLIQWIFGLFGFICPFSNEKRRVEQIYLREWLCHKEQQRSLMIRNWYEQLLADREATHIPKGTLLEGLTGSMFGLNFYLCQNKTFKMTIESLSTSCLL